MVETRPTGRSECHENIQTVQSSVPVTTKKKENKEILRNNEKLGVHRTPEIYHSELMMTQGSK
jgi:hypothetical protein